MFLCTGSSSEVQLVIIGLYGEIRETRVYISPQVPACRTGSIACSLFSHTEYSLTLIFGFLKNEYLNILFLISTLTHLSLVKLVRVYVNPGIPSSPNARLE